jgi:hypothetical protein
MHVSEFEFDQLLDAVSEAVGSGPHDHEMSPVSSLRDAPHAANDNQTAWGVVPFPADWNASC